MSIWHISCMSVSQTVVTREVTRYMSAAGVNQDALAHVLGITQGTLSRKLRGHRGWTLDDIDRLAAVGVPVSITSTAPWEAKS